MYCYGHLKLKCGYNGHKFKKMQIVDSVRRRIANNICSKFYVNLSRFLKDYAACTHIYRYIDIHFQIYICTSICARFSERAFNITLLATANRHLFH